MARKSPISIGSDRPQAPHEEQLSQMHDALYQLGDQARPMNHGSGSALLPPDLTEDDKPEAKAAKKHISKLHKAFKSVKKEKK